MNHQLIFEIGTEEIPAGYLLPALDKLKENFTSGLAALNLAHGDIKGAATPRRLTICIEELLERQPDTIEEVMGPPKKAAFDVAGKPTKAAIGFAKSRGANLENIQVVNTDKGEYLMLRQEQKGRATRELLAELLPGLIESIPFPKSMRWGSSRTSFARPIQWLLAVYEGTAIPFLVDGVGESGTMTYGHRFMAPEPIEIKNYNQYVTDLRKSHVLVDPEERKLEVLKEINYAAQEIGGHILPDAELIETVTNLVESPHAICGTFDEKFLALPKDALITSMREHQKYFAVVDDEGYLRPNFIAVNNTGVKDKILGAEGHQRVLRARLEDGLFFFKEDQTRKLEDRVADLDGIIFQAKLGTMREKTTRIQALAGWLAQKLAPELESTAKRAAFLAKSDLLSEMVNEFPSLQGIMGRDYASLDGESPGVAAAIAEHYMPVRADSPLPASLAGALVSIADRIDTIAGCFGIGQRPSGAADPFGLRRQALGLIHIIENKSFSLSLSDLTMYSLKLYGNKLSEKLEAAEQQTMEFIKGRFVNDQIRQGMPAEAVEAVVSVTFDNILDCKCRIQALNAISTQPSFPLLAGSFKRVMNIIKDHQTAAVEPERFEVKEENSLYDSYKQVSMEAQPMIDRQDYEEAMGVILKMKEPVDLFFDKVMVMADNIDIRQNRLNLLKAIANLFLQVGDFSKMTIA